MHDRDDDDEINYTEKKENTIKKEDLTELKSMIYFLNGLCDKLKSERETINLASSQMTLVSKELVAYLKKFTDVDKNIRSHITDTIEDASIESAKIVSQEIGKKVAETATHKIKQVINELSKATENAVASLNDFKESQKNSFFRRFLTYFFIGIISGFIGCVLAIKIAPSESFTQAQMEYIKLGKFFFNAWDRLSKKEKEKILRLSRDR